MTEKEIEKFQKAVDSLIDLRDYINNMEEDMELYEESYTVRKYLDLKRRLEIVKSFGVHNLSNKAIIEKVSNEIKIERANNIYVYISSYVGTHQLNSKRNSDCLLLADMPVSYDHPDVDYRKYRNIELSVDDDNYEVNILASKCKDFEDNNLVLRSTTMDGLDYYKQIRDLYFSTIYTSGEKKALDKIKVKTNNN